MHSIDMTEEQQALEAARWLVVAFVRNWKFQMLEARLWELFQRKPADFQFLPAKTGFVPWSNGSPVRAYVAQNFPKLAAFLDRATPEQQLNVASQIVRLKWNGKGPEGSLTRTERRELNKDRKEFNAAVKSYRLSRAAFKAHKSNQWNVCG